MDGDRTKGADSQFISFQDFSPINEPHNAGQAQLDIGASSHQNFNNLSNDTSGMDMIADLEGMPRASEDQPLPFWTLDYYKKYFNVNTNDVLERIKRSMIPYSSDNYLISHIRPNPDLYGPFWIGVTLVFSIAISCNMSNYLQTANTTKYHWRYDFHVVSSAITCIFLYTCLLPTIIWGALKWTSINENAGEELIESYVAPHLLELLCLYGYSLAIYIPTSFLWTIQINWLQWALVMIASLLSGGVLLRSLVPVITRKHRIIYVAVILGMHLLLAVGFMQYFFHVSSKINVTHATELVTSAASNDIVTKAISDTVHSKENSLPKLKTTSTNL